MCPHKSPRLSCKKKGAQGAESNANQINEQNKTNTILQSKENEILEANANHHVCVCESVSKSKSTPKPDKLLTSNSPYIPHRPLDNDNINSNLI